MDRSDIAQALTLCASICINSAAQIFANDYQRLVLGLKADD
jgi:hypothetical protein